MSMALSCRRRLLAESALDHFLGLSRQQRFRSRVLFFSIIAPPQTCPVSFRAPILFFLEKSWLIALALVVLVTWLRRNHRRISDLCATIGVIYIVVLALSDGFSFQYFAWSLPFW